MSLENAPLLKTALFRTNDGDRLFIAIHHPGYRRGILAYSAGGPEHGLLPVAKRRRNQTDPKDIVLQVVVSGAAKTIKKVLLSLKKSLTGKALQLFNTEPYPMTLNQQKTGLKIPASLELHYLRKPPASWLKLTMHIIPVPTTCFSQPLP
jgi:hypothetical protein